MHCAQLSTAIFIEVTWLNYQTIEAWKNWKVATNKTFCGKKIATFYQQWQCYHLYLPNKDTGII